jgi:putative transposase
MVSVLVSLLQTLGGLAQSRAALHLEVLALRHQLHVLQRNRPRRLQLATADRWLWVWLSRRWTAWRTALVIVKPETVIAWHRHAFRLLWTCRSRRRTGRPAVPRDVRTLIRTMSQANPLWGAPRIHGELLKLGMAVSQATVAKYMGRDRPPPSQTWRTFLANHIGQVVAADFFVVPTATCRLLFVLVLVAHERRRVMHVAVTDHPTAAWTAQQLREAFPWDQAPRYLLRDRDHAFNGWAETAKTMGMDELLTAPRSPWQNPFAERAIGSLRRECLDHVIVWNEHSLRRHLQQYLTYYHAWRTHLSLDKDAPVPRATQPPTCGPIVQVPHLGGLHHHYERRAA